MGRAQYAHDASGHRVYMLSGTVWVASGVSEELGHVITLADSRYEMGYSILDPLKRDNCRLWKTGKHRVAVTVQTACDEGSDETGCDFGTRSTTDLASIVGFERNSYWSHC
jgi:hypothetical protein